MEKREKSMIELKAKQMMGDSLKTLKRYIWRDSFPPFLLGLFGFIIFISVNLLYFLSLNIIDYGIPPWRLFQLLYFFMPELFAEAIPVGVLLSIFWVLSQMGTKNELMAIQVHGISFKAIVIPFLIFGTVLSIGSFLLNDYVIPAFNELKQRELKEFMSKNVGYSTISNKFLPITGNKYFYVKQPLSKNKLDDVLIYEIRNESLKVIYADELIDNKREGQWTMEDGQVLRLDNAGDLSLNVDFTQTDFEELSKELSDALEDAMSVFNEVDIYGQYESGEQNEFKYSPTTELLEKMKNPEKRARATLELNLRVAKSLSPLIIALVGTSVCLLANIKSKSWSIIFSFIFIAVFKAGEIFMQSVALHNVSSSGLGKYRLNPLIAAWVPDLTFVLLGVFVFTILDSKLMFLIKERFVRR